MSPSAASSACGLARKHDAARSIDGTDSEPVAVRRSASSLASASVIADRRHAAKSGRLLHDTAAMPDNADRLAQVEHARHMQRCDLADAVTHDGIGRHAPRLPERG